MFAIDGDFTPPCVEAPPADDDQAKAQCATCRIQLICLARALEYERLAGEQLVGVRGGLDQAQRANTTLTAIA